MTTCKPWNSVGQPHCGQESSERQFSWVALVIGVGEYQRVKGLMPLDNAPTDADRVQRLLTRNGPFRSENDVVLCKDPDKDTLFRKLAEFRKRVEEKENCEKNCIALLFYSGDGAPMHVKCIAHLTVSP